MILCDGLDPIGCEEKKFDKYKINIVFKDVFYGRENSIDLHAK